MNKREYVNKNRCGFFCIDSSFLSLKIKNKNILKNIEKGIDK